MKVNISNNMKPLIQEFYDNSCFYSSFVFVSNIIIAYSFKYYLFSFLFILLLITSLIFYTYTNIYTNVLDRIPIVLLFVYGLYLLYSKCKNITSSIKKNNFDYDNRHKICLSMIIVFSFLVTNYLFYYGYLVKEYCYHKDKKIANLWHSLLHVNTSLGFNLLMLL